MLVTEYSSSGSFPTISGYQRILGSGTIPTHESQVAKSLTGLALALLAPSDCTTLISTLCSFLPSRSRPIPLGPHGPAGHHTAKPFPWASQPVLTGHILRGDSCVPPGASSTSAPSLLPSISVSVRSRAFPCSGRGGGKGWNL